MSTEIFVNACIKGIGKTTGVVLTMLFSWKLIKYVHGNDDIISFVIGEKKNLKKHKGYHLVNSNDELDDEKFKDLFSKI
jgi:hypothetical protein